MFISSVDLDNNSDAKELRNNQIYIVRDQFKINNLSDWIVNRLQLERNIKGHFEMDF